MRKYIQEWNFGLENCHADKKGKGEKPKRIEPLNQEASASERWKKKKLTFNWK